MSNYKVLTQENFESLLLWLSPNRDEAGEKYEKIRQSLIRFFNIKCCANSEDLADETINRVVGKLDLLDFSMGNQPVTIFRGFANNVYLESIKKVRNEVALEEVRELSSEVNTNFDENQTFLDKCLTKLSEEERNLILQYYFYDKAEKVVHRQNLAVKFKLNINALHVKAHRLRKNLQKCIENAIKKNNL